MAFAHDPEALPTLYGLLIDTQFCPNPLCRRPFCANELDEVSQHFLPDSVCGAWLASLRSRPTYKVCPNPVCGQIFYSAEEAEEHLDSTTSGGTWLFEVQHGCLSVYPSVDSEFSMDVDPYDHFDFLADDESLLDDLYCEVPSTNPPHLHHPTVSTPFSSQQMCLTGLPSSAHIDFHPNSPIDKPGGQNLLQAIDADVNLCKVRRTQPYYPFSNKEEWELASWLSGGSLSQREINSFLKLDYIQQALPSFTSACKLCMNIELLPPVPGWKYQEIVVPGYPTKTKMTLYWHDGLDVIGHLYANPIFANSIQMTPYCARDSDGQRIYGEFMSGDQAWKIQSHLPQGHGFLSIIGTSDKTALTFGTGGKEMHPFLLSIANFEANVQMKTSSHAFALAAYLPIPKFLNVTKPVHSILCARVYHKCIDIITMNLQLATKDGVVMANPWGSLNAIHTPLASWIADYPEQLLISCILAKHSPISTASAQHFGDDFPHPPHTHKLTLSAIEQVCNETDPWNIPQFYKTCQRLHLSGVYKPFWETWGDADPSVFLTPDALHAWHKFFYDHVLKWVINIMGGSELDYHLMSLQPQVESRHWANSVSTLKQCTGREHRELETILVAVTAGGVPDRVVCAICALVEFIFQAQNVYHYDETLHALEEALQEFHFYKNSILDAGGRRGKSGALDHFQIPKFELMQQVTRSI